MRKGKTKKKLSRSVHVDPLLPYKQRNASLADQHEKSYMPVYNKLKKLRKNKHKNKKTRHKSKLRNQNFCSDDNLTNSMINRLSELADEDLSAGMVEELADAMEIPSPKSMVDSPTPQRFFLKNKASVDYWDTNQIPTIEMNPESEEETKTFGVSQDNWRNQTAQTDRNEYEQSLPDIIMPPTRGTFPQTRIQQRKASMATVADASQLYIVSSDYPAIKRALDERRWQPQTNGRSQLFALKFITKDTEYDFRILNPGQIFNHIPNNAVITTQAGLLNSLNSNTTYGIDIDRFYLRTYNLSQQFEAFQQDFQRTQIFAIVKKHAEYFSQDHDEFSICHVNVNCLYHALRFWVQLIEDKKDMFENENKYEFMRYYKRRFVIPKSQLQFVLEYSKQKLPISEKMTNDEKCKTCRRQDLSFYWRKPRMALVDKCLQLARKMSKYYPQWNIDGYGWYWLVKPGYVTSGNGIITMNSLDIIEDPASNRWKQRIVQKFLERPFLLNLNAESYGFVIKSWVLITETEPLTIYVFDSFIIRVESAEWNIDRPGNISSRLSSRYKHRVGSSTFFERYMAQSYPNFVAQEELLPKMHKIIITTCESCADSFKPQEGQFQLVTFSWSLDADRNPWLQKVGASSFPTCSKPDIREMLDSMAEGLLRIVLDKEEQQGPLYDLSYELQGELSFDTHIWQLLFQADIAPPPEEDFKPSANLILHGRKVNYHVEKQYDVHHFRPEAVPYIQRVTRGWFVRFEAYKKLRLSSCLIIQRNIRMFLAVCKLRHMQRKKALFHFPRILRTFLATQKVQAIKDNRLAKVTQRWYRGKRDRRTVHTMWLQNSSRVVARYFRKFWDRRNVVNKQKRNWAIVHLQMYWRRRFRMLNRQARNIQRLTRGHFGRNIYRVEKDYDDKLRLVQRWIRGYLDRRRCYHLRRLYASTFIQSVVRMLPDRKKFYRYRMAARLQSWVRMWRLRREYKRYISARKIQSVFRMYPVRVRYVRFTSARKMQALVRMFIPRMQYIKYMSARKLQTRIRGWVARRRLAKYTIVTKINALARGFIARRRHWKYFYARKIQARIREVLCRRPYQRYIAARKIQARIRTFLAENRYLTKVMQHREHIAAIKIQKIVRGYCTAKRVDIHKLIADERRRVQVAFLWEDVKDEIVRLHEEELMIIEEQLSGLVRQNSWNRLRQIAEEERLEEQRLEEIARAKDEQLMIVEDQLSEIRRSYEEIERQKMCEAGQQMARKQQQLEEERLARAQRRKEKDILKAKEIAVQAAAEEERRKRTEELRETGPAIRQFMLVEAPDITMGVIISQAGGRMENSHAGFIKEIGKQRPESPEPERLVSAHSRLPNIFQGREEPSSIEKQNIKVEDFRKVHPPAKRFD